MRFVRASTEKFPQRVLLDLSHTWNSPHQTGIQRVVRSLLRELPAVCKLRSMKFIPVVWHEHKFVRMDSLVASSTAKSWREVDKISANVLPHCHPLYRKYATKLCNLIQSRKLRRWLLPEEKHQGIFKLPLKLMKRIAGKQPVREPVEVQIDENDLLILPDGYWVMMYVWPAIAAARASGAKITVLVYDMICITHPHFFVPFAEESFTKYLRAVNEHADVVAAIAQTVQKQVTRKLTELAGPNSRTPAMTSFRLGAEFKQATGTVRKDLDDAFHGDSGSYLMVSTFEPRKNHVFVLDSFERLWQTNPECTLVFVGAMGWMSESLLQRIAAHPQYQRRLFVYHDLSDAEVNACYSRAKGVIFASITEGFGLPIVESLWHGKKTFVSDTEISREAGQDDCEYFRLDDPMSLCNLIVRYEERATDGASSSISRRKPVTWQASAENLLNNVLESLKQTQHFESHSHRRTA